MRVSVSRLFVSLRGASLLTRLRAAASPPLSLAALLVLSEIIYLAMLRLDAINGVRPVLTFLAMMGALFALYGIASVLVRGIGQRQRGALLVIAAGAVLFRLTLLPAGLPHDSSWDEMRAELRADVRAESVAYERFLLFDNDIWRYLWDGHVWAHGVNPYAHAPLDPKLDELTDDEIAEATDGRAVWGDIRENINYAATPTIYPPLAQSLFRLSHWLAPGSVLVMKTLLVGCDLLAALFIALTLKSLNRPVALVVLYAWNPLVVKVFAGSGHADALLVAALAATMYFIARGARRAAAVSFGLAVLAKLSPLVLLPFIVRRTGWRGAALMFAVLLAGYLPFLDAGGAVFTGFLTFAQEWTFNAGPYALFRWLAALLSSDPFFVARAMSGLVIVAVVCWLAWRDDGKPETFARYGAAALGALIIFSPAVMPWYVTWLLPLALVADRRVWFYFSALVCLAFLVMIDGVELGPARWVEYAALALVWWLDTRRAQSSAAAHEVLATHAPRARSTEGGVPHASAEVSRN